MREDSGQDSGEAGLLRDLAREQLGVYTSLVHRTDQGRPAIPPAHIRDYFIPAFEDDSLGNTVIIAPPASAKTMISIAACGWWIGRNPNQHIGFISSTSVQSLKRSVAVRDVVSDSPQYKAVFPKVEPDERKGWSEGEWFVKREDVGDKDPTMLATGVLGPILGARFDRVILDDIATEKNMNTAALREKIREWLTKTLLTRLTPQGRVIMICTRWHESDPAAWAIEQGWHVVHIPAVNEDTGESYWPAQWPTERLICPREDHRGNSCCKKRELGSRDFAQQYMGVVVDDDSALIKRHFWKRYQRLPSDIKTGGIFVDTAHTEKDTADYSVVTTLVTNGVNYYVKDVQRKRVEFPALVEMVLAARKREPSLPIFIEDTLGGKPLIQHLKQKLPLVIPWSIAGRSKMARVQAVLTYFEAGNVYIPANAPWEQDLIEEASAFPLGRHDDMIDTITMGLIRFTQRMPRKMTAL